MKCGGPCTCSFLATPSQLCHATRGSQLGNKATSRLSPPAPMHCSPISSLSPLSSDLLVSEKGITYFWAPVLTQSSNGEQDCEGLGQAWIKRTTEWKSTNVGFGGRKPAVLMRARPRPRRPGWDEGMSQKAVGTSFLSLSLSPHPSHGIMGALDSLALPGLGQVGRGRDAGEAASLAAEMTTVTPIAD